MHSAQYRFIRSDITFHEGQVVFSGNPVHIAEHPEIPVFRGQWDIGDFLHPFLRVFPVHDQALDCDDFQSVSSGEFHQFVSTHHGTVFAHDFATESAFFQSGQSHQVYSGFRMPLAFQDSARPGFQREHVSGPAEIFGT